jgi:hypothetical protein
MPIYLKKAVEPGSPLARTLPVILAQNDVSRRLQRIVCDYATGSVKGRSFLISGHRGAGKTTLVQKVVHDSANFLDSQSFRPLLIVLAGPSLLPPDNPKSAPDPKPAVDAKAAVDAEPKADPRPPAALETQTVLEQITLNLYRGMARHFADCLEAYVEKAGPDIRAKFRVFEWATAFRLVLDGPVELAEMRSFWSELRALETGILFRNGATRTGQGTREIAALWSCLRGYLSLAASEFSEKADAKLTASTTSEAGVKTGDKGLISALVGAGGGSAAGAVLSTFAGPVTAVLGGLATAIGGGLIFNYSASRKRETTGGLSTNLTIQRNLQSLGRELPELIRRCRDAGLAPVFLVDELDKVDRLECRIEFLVRNAKFFVTEQALFFFLTDRGYFEYLEVKTRDHAYTREHTFFSDRLFVSYTPENWRTYLKELMVSVGLGDEKTKEEQQIELLSFVVLCRARMHAIDLRRSLSAVTESTQIVGRIDLDATVRASTIAAMEGQGIKSEVLMQVAVEVTLAEDVDLVSRCQLEPWLLQVVYDALYYLSDHWRDQPRTEIAMNKDAFAIFLKERSQSLASDALSTGTLSTAAGIEADRDIDLLFRKMQRVLFWLENPDQLATEAVNHGIPDYVRAVVGKSPPLIERRASSYTWTYDAHGRKLNPSSMEDIRDNAELRAEMALIDAVDGMLKSNSSELVGLEQLQEANLFSPTPMVREISGAMKRLRGVQAGGGSYPQMDEDFHKVHGFAADVRRRSEPMARAVVSAWLITPAVREGEQLLSGWNVLKNRLTAAPAGYDDTAELVKQLFNRLQTRYKADEQPFLSAPGFEQFRYLPWGESLAAAVTRAKNAYSGEVTSWEATQEKAWQGWAQACAAFLRGESFDYKTVDAYTLDQLMTAGGGTAPASLIPFNLATMPIVTWSQMALGPLHGWKPEWLAIFALLASGFEEAATRISSIEAPSELAAEMRKTSSNPKKRKKVIILCSERPMIEGWLPHPHFACLAVTDSDIQSQLPQTGTADFVLVEAGEYASKPRTEGVITNYLHSLRDHKFLSPDSTRIAVIASRAVDFAGRYPVIVAPSGLEDAVTNAERIAMKDNRDAKDADMA